MSVGLYSSSWYRVAALRPRLRAHVAIHRQQFRGETWYVVQDHQTGRFHRLSAAANHAVCLMDGRRTVQQIWEMISDRLGEDQPTQEEMVRLLALLHTADLLLGEIPPDMDELAHRSRTLGRNALLTKLRNPMALRLPLVDPDRFLSATMPFVRPLFTPLGFLAWLALVLVGLVLAVLHWGELANNVSDQAFSAHNILLLIAVYPLLKTLHELGHAYATKAGGGEVHEMGAMFLVLVPVLYVDASASTAFREKWRRALVGGAGIMVETALASLAIILWINAEPGLVRALAFNVALIGGVSTLIFNGNPLLRFDGYYVMSDLIEIPNLAQRSNKYLFHLVRRYAFGMREEAPPVVAPGEGGWLVFYSIASFAYRLLMISGVALFIASRLFFIGIALAIMAVVAALVWPVVTGIRYVLFNPQLARHRRRAIAVSATTAFVVFALFFIVPLPYSTISEGITWVGDQSTLRALVDGFVTSIEVPSGTPVEAGTVLVRLEDPILTAKNAVLKSQLSGLQRRLEAVPLGQVVEANLIREQIHHTGGALEQNERELSRLVIKADHAGRFFVSGDAEDMTGQFLRRGDVIGYLLTADEPIIRVVVPQADADLVRRRTARIDALEADDPQGHPIPVALVREIPAATAEIPHLALATEGGGSVVLDPAHPDKPKPIETLFHFDLRAIGTRLPPLLAERVFVRFDHGLEPIAFRIARGIRQLFLRQFGV
jgi:putative peptide zinc metalloprotease protein